MIYLQYYIPDNAIYYIKITQGYDVIETRTLQLFLHLADSLHFGKTSAAMHISPSALTRTIKKLEQQLGRPLFERDNRSVSLTYEGKLFQEYARDSLLHWDSFCNSLMEKTQALQGEISIYCSVTASYSFLYDLLSTFRLAHPKIEIKLHTGDHANAIDRVLNNQEDLAIAAHPGALPAQIEFKRIATSPLIMIASSQSPLKEINIDQLTPSQWHNVPMILSEEGLARERVNTWFRQQGVTPTIYAQVSGNEAIVSMVSLGFGVGVVPQIVVENSPLSDRISALSPQATLEPFQVGLCVQKKRLQSPLINAFWQILPAQ